VARQKRTRRSNPSGLGVFPVVAVLGAATAAASLIPAVASLFQKAPETPAFHFDPNKYAQDYAAVLASQTQQAVAQQQAQAVVQAEQVKADSTKRLVIYGAIGVAVVVGAVILIRSLRKGK
jgi:hypothetical protein